jgi:hypothetical protein
MCGSTRSRHSEQRTAHEPADRNMRASDADRERAADVLRRNAGEGRLDPDELEERLEAAYSATTLADLDALTGDLPRAAGPGPDPARPREHRRSRRRLAPSPLLLAAVITLAIVVHPLIWLALMPLFWGRHGWACHSSGSHGRMRGHHPGTARL